MSSSVQTLVQGSVPGKERVLLSKVVKMEKSRV